MKVSSRTSDCFELNTFYWGHSRLFSVPSSGVFPQDEVEKVSSEEEDVDDNGRKKRKRRRQRNKGMKDEESLKKSEGLSLN